MNSVLFLFQAPATGLKKTYKFFQPYKQQIGCPATRPSPHALQCAVGLIWCPHASSSLTAFANNFSQLELALVHLDLHLYHIHESVSDNLTHPWFLWFSLSHLIFFKFCPPPWSKILSPASACTPVHRFGERGEFLCVPPAVGTCGKELFKRWRAVCRQTWC